MAALLKAIKDVLLGTWPMIVLSSIVLISLRVAYLIKNKQKMNISKDILTLTFVLYILCMFQIVTSQDVSGVHGVNITLFKELTRYEIGSKLFYRNIIGNIIMFIPFGFFVSYYLSLKRKRFVFFITFVISLVIESIQLSIGRAFDVDDIILNMVGSLTGYYLYRIVDDIFGDLSDTVKGTLTVLSILVGLIIIAIIII